MIARGEKWDLDPKSLQLRKEVFLRKAQENQSQQARKRPRAKEIRTALQYQQETDEILDRVEDSYRKSKEFEGSILRSLSRPVLSWPDGEVVNYGSLPSDAAEQFYSIFRYWGFEDFIEFFSVPMKYRNSYMVAAMEFWEELFGIDGAEIELLFRGYKQNKYTIEEILAIFKDKECTLRAGYSLIYDAIVEEVTRCEGWEREMARKRAEASFRRPLSESNVADDPYYWKNDNV